MRKLLALLFLLTLSACDARQREQEGAHSEAVDDLAADTSMAGADTIRTNTGEAPVPPRGH